MRLIDGERAFAVVFELCLLSPAGGNILLIDEEKSDSVMTQTPITDQSFEAFARLFKENAVDLTLPATSALP